MFFSIGFLSYRSFHEICTSMWNRLFLSQRCLQFTVTSRDNKAGGLFRKISLIIILVSFRSHPQGSPLPGGCSNTCDSSKQGSVLPWGSVTTWNCAYRLQEPGSEVSTWISPEGNPGGLKINSSCMKAFPKSEMHLMVRGPISVGRDSSKEQGNSWIQMIWSPGWA